MNMTARRKLNERILFILIVIGAVICLFPIYEMISTSLKYEVEAFSIPPKWIFTPTLENYGSILTSNNFGRYFVNSIIVALSTTFFSVIVGALAGYSISRFGTGEKSLL